MGREGWTIGKVPIILPLSDNLDWMRMNTSEANPRPPFTPDEGKMQFGKPQDINPYLSSCPYATTRTFETNIDARANGSILARFNPRWVSDGQRLLQFTESWRDWSPDKSGQPRPLDELKK
jgi:hypothetical protein